MRRLLLFLTLLLAGAAVQAAELRVVASSTSMAALVREVAGSAAELQVLGPPDRDLHYLQLRPSMIRYLRDADLVVAVGAELEVGWLPLALEQSTNTRVLPGQPGYFEAAAQVELRGAGAPADRARGDVHPAGDPHVNMDPVRMARVAQALAERLAALDPAREDDYRRRAEAFGERVRTRLARWRQQVAGAPGVLLYHSGAEYLLERLEVPVLGYIEPIPGVPPTGRHLAQLVAELEGRQGVIIHEPYYPEQAPRQLAERLGWPREVLAIDPPLGSDGSGYLDHIGTWVEAVAAGAS